MLRDEGGGGGDLEFRFSSSRIRGENLKAEMVGVELQSLRAHLV